MREIGDGRFAICSNVVDAQMLATLQHMQHTIDHVANVDKRASLTTCALDRKLNNIRLAARLRDEGLQPHDELRDHVLASHVRTVNVVRAKYHGALEKLASIIDQHKFTDDLAAAVGIPRIEYIGNTQWHILWRGYH